MFEISLVMAAVQMQHTCLQQNVLRVAATFKYQLNFVNFQGRLVLAAMQKNWSLFLQNLYSLHIILLVKLFSLVELSPVLVAVQMQ